MPPNSGRMEAMPTPFTHLALAQRLVKDPALPADHRQLLRVEWGAFLLGSIAPDSQHKANLLRADTHFFQYKMPIQPPVEVMLNRYPHLAADRLPTADHQAFVAGYVGHLAVDETWWATYAYPHYAAREWGEQFTDRLFALHGVLSLIDARDYSQLSPDVHHTLQRTQPDEWLPFLPDAAICGWRDTIARQLGPDGQPETVVILGSRVPQGPDALQQLLDDPDHQQTIIWQHVPRAELEAVEERMYRHMRATVRDYLNRLDTFDT